MPDNLDQSGVRKAVMIERQQSKISMHTRESLSTVCKGCVCVLKHDRFGVKSDKRRSVVGLVYIPLSCLSFTIPRHNVKQARTVSCEWN